MCEALGNCEYCAYDKSECNFMGCGTPICTDFVCIAPKEVCEKHSNCISLEEEMELVPHAW